MPAINEENTAITSPAGPHQHDGDHAGGSTRYVLHRHRDVAGGPARAAVFGFSDGLVSNVALILGVAAAASTRSSVLVAGVAGLLAGAASMAAGEYVSMKAQAELIERELDIERHSLKHQPHAERRELADLYRSRGLDPTISKEMASEVMKDPEVALEVHAREELGVDPSETGRPVLAASSSFVAFAIGAIIPLIPWLFAEGTAAIVGSAVLGVLATVAVGALIAMFTERSKVRTILRQLGWGSAAAILTWLIGTWLGGIVG